MVEAVNDEHEGWQQGSVADLYRTAWERIRPLVCVSLLTGLGIAAGTLLLIVPGIVLAVRWSLAVPVVMLEKESPCAAMRRSRELVRGHGWAVFPGPAQRRRRRLAQPERPVIADSGERW